MNIKVTHKWLLDYLDTDVSSEELSKYLSLCGPSIERIEKVGDEIVYDIEITSNRIDTASIMGIARESVAILNRFNKKATIKQPLLAEIKPIEKSVPLSITDSENLTRRVLGIVLEVDGVKPSPEYIQKRLTAVGIRSLNNIVDITNYVMTEIGHPTHVFDYDRIESNTLIIRHAKNDEEIVTLDEKKYKLCDTDIIIDDGTGKVIDLPGIMGTANSVVTEKTKRILFFIESNDPVAIRRSSMKYGIRTVASTINEKNPDPELALIALLRGVELYKKEAGAKIISNLIDIYSQKPKIIKITVSKEFIDKKIGTSIPLELIISILKDLEFGVEVDDESLLTVTVPSYRAVDVSIPEDIVEEVARIYGYFSIPSVLQKSEYVAQPPLEEKLFTYQNSVKMLMKHVGYSEVMNYSAVSLDLLNSFEMEKLDHLHITNSISEDIKYLRRQLLPSLIKNIKQNEGFEEKLRLFEVAKTYIPQKNSLPLEEFKLAIITNTSFDDLKGTIAALFRELNIDIFEFQSGGGTNDLFAKDAQGQFNSKLGLFGSFGLVKTQYSRVLGISRQVYGAEFDFMKLVSEAKTMPTYHSTSQFASINFDLTIPKNKPFVEIRKIAFSCAPHLVSFSLKDLYKDTITLHLTFSDSKKNMTEKEAQEELNAIKALLEKSG